MTRHISPLNAALPIPRASEPSLLEGPTEPVPTMKLDGTRDGLSTLLMTGVSG